MKQKYAIVLEALEQGRYVEISTGHELGMVDGTVVVIGWSHPGNTIVHLPCWLDLNGFLQECEDMDDAYITKLTAGIALTKARQKGLRV